MKKLSFGFLMFFCLNCIFALENKKADTYKTHETSDKNAPVVYFTSGVSSQGLMKVYKAEKVNFSTVRKYPNFLGSNFLCY